MPGVFGELRITGILGSSRNEPGVRCAERIGHHIRGASSQHPSAQRAALGPLYSRGVGGPLR